MPARVTTPADNCPQVAKLEHETYGFSLTSICQTRYPYAQFFSQDARHLPEVTFVEMPLGVTVRKAAPLLLHWQRVLPTHFTRRLK